MKRPTEEEYREAAEIWKKEHPTAKRISQRATAIIKSGREIKIGTYLSNLKNKQEKLTEEQIEYWQQYHAFDSLLLPPTEEEYREAAKIWKQKNTESDYISQGTIVSISSGKKINIGSRMNNMRMHLEQLTEDQKKFWEQYGLFKEKKKQVTEEEYRKALQIWKKSHPKVKNIPQTAIIKLENEKIILLGNRIAYMKSHIQNLSEEQKVYWSQYVDLETKRDKITEEEYQEAAKIWKKEYPTKKYIPTNTIVTITSGKKVALGTRVMHMKESRIKLSEEQRKFWEEYHVFEKFHPTEEEYREAVRIWKDQNPGKKFIKQNTKVIIMSGKEILLGRRINYIKNHSEKLTEEQKIFWSDYENLEDTNRKVTRNHITEEEYREAAKIWREQNKTANKICQNKVITIKNGKEISLGNRVSYMKRNINKLTEEQKEYWSQYNVFDSVFPTEEEYREAARIWREQNPKEDWMKVNAEVIIASGKRIKIGKRLENMRSHPERLTEEQRDYWEKQGALIQRKILKKEITENSFWKNRENQPKKNKLSKRERNRIEWEKETKEGYELWKKSHPHEKISPKDRVILTNGKEIPLGHRIVYMEKHPEKLTEEQMSYWKFQGRLEDEKDLSYKKFQKGDLKDIFRNYIFYLSGDDEKAYHIVNCLKETRKPDPKIEDILRSLQISEQAWLNGIKRFNQEEPPKVEQIKKEQTLTEFCSDYGYDQEKLELVLRYQKVCKNDTLEQLVNRVVVNYNMPLTRPSGWIYELYGNNISEILEYLNLDATKVLKKMSAEVMPLEEALCDLFFEENNKRSQYNWVEVPLVYLTSMIKIPITAYEIEKITTPFSKKHYMNKEEHRLLKDCLLKYATVIHEYHKIDVGLEIDDKRKHEKIEDYQLSNEDIEESFFLPLELNSDKLVGKAKTLYNRKQLLRQYVIDWNLYDDKEKIEVIKKEKICQEEVFHIERARTKIDEMIAIRNKNLILKKVK